MPKWMEVVSNGYFGKDLRKEIMLGHVEEVAGPGEDFEGVSDLVGVRGVRQYGG